MKFVKKILLFSVSIISILIISGCGKSNNTPAPPRAQSDLIVELFQALKENNYTLASQKVKRLRMLNPTDFYLANIEYQVQIDSGFNHAQELVNAGKIKEAYSSLTKTIEKYGNQDNLTAAKDRLKILSEIDSLTKKIVKAKTSSKIALPTGELNRIILNNKFADSLKPFTEYSLDKARKLMTAEDIMAQNDLKADLDIVRIVDPSTAQTMIAQLTIEEAQDKTVDIYKESLSKDWEQYKSKTVEIPSNSEILYFRQALTAPKSLRDSMFTKLLSIPPSSFSSMLIRSFILYTTGYQKEAKALTQLITSLLQLNNEETAGWFDIIPTQNTNFNSLNPFVLYPFFVYCE